VIGSELSFDFAENKDKFNFFVAVSVMPTIQRNKQRRLDFIQIVDNHNLQCATLIHPTANIFDTATIGAGSFVGFCSAVSSYCQIGQHCQIQSMSVIGHHSTFGHNSVLDRTAYIIGNARVGSNVNIGFGSAVVKTFATVGDNAVIHPRITVMRDVDQNEIVSLAGDNTRRIYGEIIRH
jgi:UDP-3-O-[3-hydroxymyristoyl] glucosamine N-acyltransferase